MVFKSTSKYEKSVVCPKCGEKGYQKLIIRTYEPRTKRFRQKKRVYKTRVVVHRLPDGKTRTCVLKNLNPVYQKKEEVCSVEQ